MSTSFTTTLVTKGCNSFALPRAELRSIGLPVSNPFVNSEARPANLFIRLFDVDLLGSLKVASATLFKLV